MADVYSISVNGIHSGERDLERAARRIAAGPAGEKNALSAQGGDAVRISPDGIAALTSSGELPVDYAAEMVTVLQARTTIEANLKVLKMAASIEQDTLNLLG